MLTFRAWDRFQIACIVSSHVAGQSRIRAATRFRLAFSTVAKIDRVLRGSNNTLEVVVRGLERFRIDHWLSSEPYLRAHTVLAPDLLDEDVEEDALVRTLRDLTKEVFGLSPNLPKEVGIFLDQVRDPRHLIYLLASSIRLGVEKGQAILEQNHVKLMENVSIAI